MDSLQKISNDLVQSINEKEKKKSIPYDTYAKVIRIDGGTAWVHIPGGVDETPVALTVNAKVGDSVLVRVSGGNAWIVGNSSAPPTDDTKAVEAKGVADVAQVKAESAEEVAKNASRAVKSTSQYFWHTETDTGAGAGAHITEVPQEDFIADPANGGGNLLAQSGGITARQGTRILATFGAGGCGLTNENDVNVFEVGYNQQDTYENKIDVFVYNNENPFTVTLPWDLARTDNVNFYYYSQFPNRTLTGLSPTGHYTVSERSVTLDSFLCEQMIAADVVAVGVIYTASGRFPTYTVGTRADRQGSTAGPFSMALGENNIAKGHTAVAMGESNVSRGINSIAIGQETESSSRSSVALGLGTIASWPNQMVIGKYNAIESEASVANSPFIIGNGTDTDANFRSTAFRVNWGGEVFAAGGIRVNGHTSEIGHKTTRQTGTYSLASGKSFVTVPDSNLSRITLSKGTWIIHAHAAFASNNNGRRAMRIYDTTTSEGLTRSFINQPATNDAATNMQTMAIVSLGESNTYTLQLAQNSGSAKSVDLILEAVRIA